MSSTLTAATTSGRQRAARLLLRHSLITKHHPSEDALALVRRHRDELREQFGRILGYRLEVTPTYARLIKRPLPDLEIPALTTQTGRAFNQLDYSYLALLAAALERLGAQTTISLIAAEIASLASSFEDVDVDLDSFAHRRALIAAVAFFEHKGVIILCDGQASDYESGGDALYDIDREVLTHLVSAPVSIQLAETAADLYQEPYADNDDGRRQRMRHQMARRVVECPVVYREDLTTAEIDYLNGSALYMCEQIEALTGCQVERRAEGFLLIDESDGEMSDLCFPGASSLTKGALIIGERLVELREEKKSDALTKDEIDEIVLGVHTQYLKYLKRDYRDNIETFRRDCLDLLKECDLIRESGEGLRVMPAMARYRSHIYQGTQET